MVCRHLVHSGVAIARSAGAYSRSDRPWRVPHRNKSNTPSQIDGKGAAVNRLSMMMVALVIALGSGFAAHAATMSDPAIGTWVLNVEKSKFTPGPEPKSQTRTYTQTADGVTLTISGVAADGSTMSGTSTFK